MHTTQTRQQRALDLVDCILIDQDVNPDEATDAQRQDAFDQAWELLNTG